MGQGPKIRIVRRERMLSFEARVGLFLLCVALTALLASFSFTRERLAQEILPYPKASAMEESF